MARSRALILERYDAPCYNRPMEREAGPQGGPEGQSALAQLLSLSDDWEQNLEQYYPGIERDRQWMRDTLQPGALACFIVGDFVLRRTPNAFRTPATERLIDAVLNLAIKAERVVGIRSKEADLVTLFDLMSKFSSAERRLGLEVGGLQHLIHQALDELTNQIHEASSM